MNSERSNDAMSLADALSVLDASNDEVVSAPASHAPVCRMLAQICRFGEYGLLAGEPASFAEAWPPGENCPVRSETGMYQAREGRPLGGRVYDCDRVVGPVMPEITESKISRIKRITCQAGLAWDDRPAHERLKSTDAVWRIPSTDRIAGERAATTTGGSSSHGNRPSMADS